MPLEIERKFLLLNDSYKEASVSHSHIVQGYICSERGRTVRVRLRDGHAFLTIKGPSSNGGLSRYEFEKEISIDEGRNLIKLCQGGLIEKTRWLVPVGKHVFEVDEFAGDNEGLVVAEVELSAEEEKFERPDFLGEEVTGNRAYYNSMLRERPFKSWKMTKMPVKGNCLY